MLASPQDRSLLSGSTAARHLLGICRGTPSTTYVLANLSGRIYARYRGTDVCTAAPTSVRRRTRMRQTCITRTGHLFRTSEILSRKFTKRESVESPHSEGRGQASLYFRRILGEFTSFLYMYCPSAGSRTNGIIRRGDTDRRQLRLPECEREAADEFVRSSTRKKGLEIGKLPSHFRSGQYLLFQSEDGSK